MMPKLKSMQQLWKNSYLASENMEYIEALYETYLKDPDQLSPEWLSYFDELAAQSGMVNDISHEEIQQYFKRIARLSKAHQPALKQKVYDNSQGKVIDLTYAYRRLG